MVVLAALVLAAGGSGCSSGLEVPDRIVLVTIDTLRADHVGAYGYPLAITPFLDSLAEQGVVFRIALAQATATAPSHASLFTGLYPFQLVFTPTVSSSTAGFRLWQSPLGQPAIEPLLLPAPTFISRPVD